MPWFYQLAKLASPRKKSIMDITKYRATLIDVENNTIDWHPNELYCYIMQIQ
jgi:hypothetical protein